MSHLTPNAHAVRNHRTPAAELEAGDVGQSCANSLNFEEWHELHTVLFFGVQSSQNRYSATVGACKQI